MAEIKIKVWALVAGLVGAILACLFCLLLGAGVAFVVMRVEAQKRQFGAIQREVQLTQQLKEAQARAEELKAQLDRGRNPNAEGLGRGTGVRANAMMAGPGFDPVPRRTASVENGEIINIDFAGEPKKKGVAAIGNNDGDFWNHYHFQFALRATMPELKTTSGRATGAIFQTHSLPGEWGWNSPDPMWGSYSYSETDKGFLRFPNLPQGSYHLYLFMHSGGELNPAKDWEAFGRAQVEANGKDYGVLATEASKEFLSTDWKEGVHYVVFEDLEIRPGGMLNITLLRGGNNTKPSINGLQLRRVR